MPLIDDLEKKKKKEQTASAKPATTKMTAMGVSKQSIRNQNRLAEEKKKPKTMTVKTTDKSWYKGDSPTEVETVARIMQTGLTDKEKGREQYSLYEQAKAEGHWAETYDKPTSSYASALGLTDVNENTIEALRPYLAGAVHTSTGGLSSAKKNGEEAMLAYNISGLIADYEDTQELLYEEEAAKKEASYWMDKGLSDEEIKQKLAIGKDGSKYKKLTSAVNKAANGGVVPTTAPVYLATSYGVDGMLYALRNPDSASGNYFTDAVQGAMGRGVKYSASNEDIARRTPGSETYAPYADSTTMDDEAIRFGVGTNFSREWVDQNRAAILGSGDADAIKAFGKVYEAEQRTQKVEQQMASLATDIEKRLNDVSLYESEEDFINKVFGTADAPVYDELAALDDSMLSGKVVGLTRGVGYDRKALEAEARKRYAIARANADAGTDPAALDSAVANEREALVAQNGTISSNETLPKSATAKTGSMYDESADQIVIDGANWASSVPAKPYKVIASAGKSVIGSAGESKPIYDRMAGKFSSWTDEQKDAASDYIYNSENEYDLSESIIAMREAGLSDEQINSFRSEVSEAISTAGYFDDPDTPYRWFEGQEAEDTEAVDKAQAEQVMWEAIGAGDYLTAAEIQYGMIDSLITESDDPYVADLVHSEGSQKAAASLMTMVVEGRLTDKIQDPAVKKQLQNFEQYAKKALALDEGLLTTTVRKLDNLLNMNGQLIAAQENDGLGLSVTLQLMIDSAMSKGASFVDDLIGQALITGGEIIGSEKVIETGKHIASVEDQRQAGMNEILTKNGTPLEILAGQYGSEAVHVAMTGKISAGLMSFAKAKFAGSMKFLTRVIGSSPFAAKAGTAEFHDTYAETGDALTSNAVGLGAGAVTALMSQWDGVLNNIEAAGLPYIPEIVGKLSTVPGSGALAGVGRWGKAFGLWLGNVGKTAVNEFLQEPAENVATTFLTDLIKGKNPLDRDWKEYGKELMSEGVGAAIISLGSSAATLPPYARTAKVIESQLGKSELTAADVETFVNAMKEDMKDPQLVEEAQNRAENIAVEVRTGELVSEGALPEVDMSAVGAAEQAVQEKAEAAAQATAEKDSAYVKFRENPADDAAKSRLSAAVKQEQKAVKDAQDAQAELAEAQASVQAQSEAVMGAVREQAESEVQGSLRANVENRLARESVSGYNEPAGGVTNGEANRGYDGRGSSGSDAEGRGGNPKRDGLVRRTAVESSAADASRGSLAGVVTRESRGFESFKRATSEGLKGEDGNPLILYHGTGEDFEMLERRDGRNYDTSNGVYLTNSLAVANEYAFRSSNTGKQYIHPVAVNSQKVVYFDGDSFMQNPDYQNYVAKQIEKYNRYADKEGFAEKLDIALAHEVNDGYIDDDIAQAIKDAYALHGRIDVVGVLNTQWNFGMPDSDNQYIVFDPSLLVPATEAYWDEQASDTPTTTPETPTSKISYDSSSGTGVSQFAAQTGQKTSVLSDTVKQELRQSPFYQKTSQKKNVERAIGLVETEGYERRKNKLLDGTIDLFTPEGQVEAYVLAKTAKANGDVEGESAIAFRVKESGTQLGQALAMRTLYAEMTPEGKQQFIDRIVEQINSQYERKGSEVRVTAPEWLAKRLEEAGDDADAVSRVYDECYAYIAEQMPPDWKSRLNAWRYTAMLANPRTHIRNIAGNLLFTPAVKLKNQIAAVGELTVPAEKRTKILGAVKKEYRDFAQAKADEVKDLLTGGGKHNPMNEIQDKRRSFNSKLLNDLARKNTDLLEKEDALFLNRHFTSALGGFLQARNADLNNLSDAVLAEGIAYAVDEAKKATFRDSSKIAESLSKFAREMSNSPKMGDQAVGLLVEGALPFKKTPVNVMKRGVEYSPVALLGTLTKGVYDLQRGNIDANVFWDRIGSGLTGTALAALGGWLGHLGILKLSLDDKEDELEKLQGSQEYSVEIGGVSFTIDWLSPSAMPLFVGGAIAELIEADGDELNLDTLVDATMNIAEPVFNLSMLDGVNSLLSAASYSENGVVDVAMRAAEGYATQFVPTALGALARTIDRVRRTTYTDKNIGVPSSAQYLADSTINKIPWLSTTGQPYLNAWGEEDVTESAWLRAIENFVSPGYVNQVDTEDVESKLMELFDATGDTGLIPSLPQKYFTVDGEKVDLTGEQYEQLTKERGQKAKALHEELFADAEFLSLPAEYQAKALGYAWDYATTTAKNSINGGVTVAGWMKDDDIFQSIMEKVRDSQKSDQKNSLREGLYDALDAGDISNAATYVEGLKELGSDRSGIKTSVTNHYKPVYMELYKDGDLGGMLELEDALLALDLGYKRKDFAKWLD